MHHEHCRAALNRPKKLDFCLLTFVALFCDAAGRTIHSTTHSAVQGCMIIVGVTRFDEASGVTPEK